MNKRVTEGRTPGLTDEQARLIALGKAVEAGALDIDAALDTPDVVDIQAHLAELRFLVALGRAVQRRRSVFTRREGVNDPVTGLFDAIYAEAAQAERSRG